MIRKAVGNDKLSVKLENLRDKKTASMLTVDEQSRRMADMMKMYAASGMPMGLDSFAKEGQTLILNAKHPLVKYVMEHDEDKNTKMICQQLYDLAQIAGRRRVITGAYTLSFTPVSRTGKIILSNKTGMAR